MPLTERACVRRPGRRGQAPAEGVGMKPVVPAKASAAVAATRRAADVRSILV